MSIKNHLGNLNTTFNQFNAIQKLKDFLLNDIYIIKGYTGTSKMTLISSLNKRKISDYVI